MEIGKVKENFVKLNEDYSKGYKIDIPRFAEPVIGELERLQRVEVEFKQYKEDLKKGVHL